MVGICGCEEVGMVVLGRMIGANVRNGRGRNCLGATVDEVIAVGSAVAEFHCRENLFSRNARGFADL